MAVRGSEVPRSSGRAPRTLLLQRDGTRPAGSLFQALSQGGHLVSVAGLTPPFSSLENGDLIVADLRRVEFPEMTLTEIRRHTRLPILVVFTTERQAQHAMRRMLLKAGAADAMPADASNEDVRARAASIVLQREPQRVLVAHPDGRRAACMSSTLRAGFLDTVEARSTGDAKAVLAKHPIDACVLHVGAHEGDGLKLLSELRAASAQIPVLALAGPGATRQRIAALRIGADDCADDPLDPEELLVRVLRLTGPVGDPYAMVTGALELRWSDRIARYRGTRILLRDREFALLAFMARREGLVIPRRVVIEDVWGTIASDSAANAVAATKSRLCSTFKGLGAPAPITGVRGGYRFAAEAFRREAFAVAQHGVEERCAIRRTTPPSSRFSRPSLSERSRARVTADVKLRRRGVGKDDAPGECQ